MPTRQLQLNRCRPRGVILVVVVACLALFLGIGIAFVFYANQQADSMRLLREAAHGGRAADVNQYSRGMTDEAPPSAVDLFNLALGQLIYGVPDDETGYYSVMRGHELARGIYGKNVFAIASAVPTTLQPLRGGPALVYAVITTAQPNGLSPGDAIRVSGIAPAPYNGPFVVSPAGPNDPAPPPTPTTFYCQNPAISAGAATSFGVVQKTSNAPFDGFGRVHYTYASNDPAAIADPALVGQDSHKIVNYVPAVPGSIRDPELEIPGVYIAKNAPYTYPDENNMFLAAVRPFDARVLIPSFHRPWLSEMNGLADTTFGNRYRSLRAQFQPNTTIPIQNFMGGTTPDGSWGDVENLPGKGGMLQYDSIWIDLDAPVHTWRGQYYKPLFAFLICDFDSRININTAGNIKGAGGAHAANMGIGPWEVDPTYVLNSPYQLGAKPVNWPTNQVVGQLLRENATLSRFGPGGGQPAMIYCLDDTASPNAVPPLPIAPGGFGALAPFYGSIDLDGSTMTTAPGAWTAADLQARAAFPLPNYYTAPVFGVPAPPTPAPAQKCAYHPRYGNGSSTIATSNPHPPGERDYHPLLYNPYFAVPNSRPAAGRPANGRCNLSFSPWEMFYLNAAANHDAVNYPLSPALGKLSLPVNSGAPPFFMLGDPSLAAPLSGNRMQFTTISNDLQRPGIRPWVWANPWGRTPLPTPATPRAPVPPLPPAHLTYAQYQYTGAANAAFPVGGPINSPTGGAPQTPPAGPPPQATDFDPAWRSNIAAGLGSIDLNRPLADYRVDPRKKFEDPGNVTDASAQRAVHDRQLLARDIFYRLLVACGINVGFHPTLQLPQPTITYTDPANDQQQTIDNPEFLAARRLAQLAVNIVDYIDNDDCMTPFNWRHPDSPPAANDEVLFGTELPRLVINEFCIRVRNDPSDLFNLPGSRQNPQATRPYRWQLWMELHNPLTPPNNAADPNLSFGGRAPLVHTTSANGQSQGPQGVYQIVVEQGQDLKLRDLDNATGAPAQNTPPKAPFTRATFDFVDAAANYLDANGDYLVQWSNGAQGGLPAKIPVPSLGMNPSFIVIGPTGVPGHINPNPPGNTPEGNTSAVPVTFEIPQMQGTLGTDVASSETEFANFRNQKTTILLQRLACPYLPRTVANNPNNGLNPFVTVDYVDGTAARSIVFDARQCKMPAAADATGKNVLGNTRSIQQFSTGKTQPYTSLGVFWQAATDNSGWKNDDSARGARDWQADANEQGFNHTFYKHNTGPAAFGWLAHLDRKLISPVELFNVSTWKPHELTQQFFTGTIAAPVKYQHLAQWNGTTPAPTAGVTPLPNAQGISVPLNTSLGSAPSPNNANDVRLYRALGLLDVRERTLGMPFGGRIPGRVNINTIWDSQVGTITSPASATFSALCAIDASINYNSQANVDAIWSYLAGAKANILPANTNTLYLPAWTPGPGLAPATWLRDQPFVSAANYTTALITPNNQNLNPPIPTTAIEQELGSGAFPQPAVTPPNPAYPTATNNREQGIQQTILGLPGLVPGAFPPSGADKQVHPYLRNELLNKLYNNTTTRSNTFAVYCTIGYFQVTNSGPYSAVNRPLLGQELGIGDGTNIRHKFYAIVDRTNLTIETPIGGVGAATARPRQGQRPVFLSYEPLNTDANGSSPDPLQNRFIDPRVPDPDTTQYLPHPPHPPNKRAVAVRVPATGACSAQDVPAVSGIYDGQHWMIKDGDTILLDTGANQEQATVEVASNAFSSGTNNHAGPGIGAKIILHLKGGFAGGQPLAHSRGCVMQLNFMYSLPGIGPAVNVLGNPGPQPDFNYKDLRYSAVVPMAVQIK